MKKILIMLVFAVTGFLLTGSVNAPEPRPVESTVYYASTKSSTYHLPSCKYVKAITPDHLVMFRTREQAEHEGYRPCKVCKP